MSNDDVTNANGGNSPKAQKPAESGYGSPTPEDEMPATDTVNPGSADPTLRGQQTDTGSDGEPGAGRLGGTDEQFRDEKDMADPSFAHVDPADETPVETPSTDAPLHDDNAGPTRPERESFSSESDKDAAGE